MNLVCFNDFRYTDTEDISVSKLKFYTSNFGQGARGEAIQ